MSAFSGKVKNAKAVNKGIEREYQTIVIIENDVNNEVDTVKVTYPSSVGPNPIQTTCVFTDEINNDRFYKDTLVKFKSTVAGKTVDVEVLMLDCAGNELKTEKAVKLSFV